MVKLVQLYQSWFNIEKVTFESCRPTYKGYFSNFPKVDSKLPKLLSKVDKKLTNVALKVEKKLIKVEPKGWLKVTSES